MEYVVQRRMSMIYSHLTGIEESSAAPTHVLLPMNCSSYLNSVIQRGDNRTTFARQASVTQACFMRPDSAKQDIPLQQDLPLNCSDPGKEKFSSQFSGAPLFSRPVRTDLDSLIAREIQCVKQEHESSVAAPPKFARPHQGMSRQCQACIQKIKCSTSSNGIGMQWSPRRDIAVYGRNYIVIVELPGVNTSDIRVEVNDQNLIVTGSRLTQFQSMRNISEESDLAYLQREILQGPYQVVWPLPCDVNKDSVSAEFRDGFLQITLPKL